MTGYPQDFSDIIVFSANGQDGSKCLDQSSSFNGKPFDDIVQDIECSIETWDGKVKFTATRFLDTGDVFNDFLIPLDQEFYVAFAVNRDTSDLN